MLSKKHVSLIAIVGVAVILVLIAPMLAQTMGLAMGIVSITPVFAQTTNTNANGNAQSSDIHRGEGFGWGSKNRIQPGVLGTVSAVSGNTITVTSKFRPRGNSSSTSTTATTYTVDASKATVTKNGASSSVSNIAVGDTIMVQGTVSGTNVAATSIRDNTPGQKSQKPENQNPIVQGNGQPIVSGNVTSVSGNTITITNKSNVTYMIDATNAVIKKGSATSTLSGISTGDSLIVQGTVNGNSVTASSIIDTGAMAGNSNSSKPHPGFLGGIFGFFQHLFGF